MNQPQPQPTLNLTNAPAKPRTRTKKPARTPPLDWAATHGPLTGALSATTGAAAVALGGAAAGMPPGLPLAVGVAGAIGHGLGHTIHRRLTARTLTTRAASWLLAGGWTTWAITSGPLTWAAAGTLAALGVGIGAMASNAAVHEEAAEAERLDAEARARAAGVDKKLIAVAVEWEQRIKRVCMVDVTVFAVEHWATGAGYAIAADLPGGALWTQIRDRARALAADARLPRGCVIHVEEGDVQGRVVLDIPTKNVMADTITYPDDYTPLSILTGVPWGLLPHMDPVTVMLREACALILGPPGSGKSTFLDAVIAGFARCTDVLTWVVDLKAGAVGIPWVRPWLEAQGHKPPKQDATLAPANTRPGIDWLAGTPEEALQMFEAVLAINAARQQQYQDLMDEQNTTLLPISAKIPQIQIVIDEGAELLSAQSFGDDVTKRLQAAVKKTMRTTRAMGIRLVLTAVDGNVSAIGNTEVRKFSPVGVALTSGENSGNNLGKLFPRARTDTTQLNAKGSGVIGSGTENGFAPTPFKGWKTSPNMVRDVVLATNHLRPTLDDVSARAAGHAYAERWTPERAGWLWGATTIQPTTITPDTTTAPTTPARSDRPTLNLSYNRRNQPNDTDADAMAAKLLREIDEKYGTTDEPDRDPDTTNPHGLNLSYKNSAAPAGEATDPRRSLIRRLVEEAGPAGMDTSDIWSALTARFGQDWNRTVATTWMSDDVRAGLMHRPSRGRIAWGPKPLDEQAGE